MKFIGLLAAFYFFYGLVEDCNRFDIQNISMWMGLAMCLSEEFRSMSDKEFTMWFKSLFVVTAIKKNTWSRIPVSQEKTLID
jgi:hypothetical protein